MPVKRNLFFQKFVAGEIKIGVMNEVKALNKKVEELCKSKNLALIRQLCQSKLSDKKKLHLHEKGISTLVIRFKKYLLKE